MAMIWSCAMEGRFDLGVKSLGDKAEIEYTCAVVGAERPKGPLP